MAFPAFLHPTPLLSFRTSLPSTTTTSPLHPPRTLRFRPPTATAAASSDPLTPTPSSQTPSQTSQSSTPSEFHTLFADLRGKAIEPVSATLTRFNAAFPRPVPIVYRGIINELLTTSHLSTVCAMWRFDSIFACGFNAVFTDFLKYYPSDDERTVLYKACASALGFEMPTLQACATSVNEWIEGKTEEDVFSALQEASPGAKADAVGPVVEALVYIRDAGKFDWYYSRLFGIGLIQVMAGVGAELSAARAEVWAEKIGMEPSKFASEMGSYLSSVERLKQAEQIFAESTAREAKKTADRLAARAEAAVKEAEELEKEDELVETVAEVDKVDSGIAAKE